MIIDLQRAGMPNKYRMTSIQIPAMIKVEQVVPMDINRRFNSISVHPGQRESAVEEEPRIKT